MKRSEYLADWLEPTEEERKLEALGAMYHRRCDAYDAGRCSGISPRTGEAMPIGNEELGLVNQHAQEMRRETIIAGYSEGFSEEQVIQAIRNHVRRE